MTIMILINDLLRFLLELFCIGVFGYFGYKLSIPFPFKLILGITFPLLLILFWSYFGAPKSVHRLEEPFLLITKIIIFSLTAIMLYFTENKNIALLFSIIISINTFLTYKLK